MKKFIAFFVLIYKWFISLFASKKKKKTLAELYEEAKKEITVQLVTLRFLLTITGK